MKLHKKTPARENFEVEKVEHENSNLIHLTSSDSNQSGSNQVDSNHSGYNNVAAHQDESNHVRFDTDDSNNIKQIYDTDFHFIRDVLSWVVVHLIRENETLLMVQNYPTTLHYLPGDTCKDFHQQLSSHLWKIIHHSTTHIVQYQM